MLNGWMIFETELTFMDYSLGFASHQFWMEKLLVTPTIPEKLGEFVIAPGPPPYWNVSPTSSSLTQKTYLHVITCKGFERPNAQSKACRQVAIVPSSIPANFAVLVPAEQLVQKKLLIFHKWSYSEWLIDCLLDFACLLAGLLAWLIVVRSKSWLRLMFLISKQLTMGSWGVVPDTTAEAPSFWSHFLSTQSKSEKSTHTIQLYIISVSIPYKPYTRQCFKQLLRF